MVGNAHPPRVILGQQHARLVHLFRWSGIHPLHVCGYLPLSWLVMAGMTHLYRMLFVVTAVEIELYILGEA